MHELRILRRPEVQAITGLKRTRIDELEKLGQFPQRVRISQRACGWRSDEIQEWIESRPRADVTPADTENHLHREARG